MGRRRRQCEACGPIDGEAICPGRDRGERDRTAPTLYRTIERLLVAACQQRLFVKVAALPHGPHGVSDEARRQRERRREHDVANAGTAQCAAMCKQCRTRGTMNRPVDATAAAQRPIRSVDDHIGRQRGDVGDDKPNGRHALNRRAVRDLRARQTPAAPDSRGPRAPCTGRSCDRRRHRHASGRGETGRPASLRPATRGR